MAFPKFLVPRDVAAFFGRPCAAFVTVCSKENMAMRTDLEFDAFYLNDMNVSDSDLIGFARPADIVDDPILTVARKRQLLAFWASDIHAVSGSPALRSVAFGPTVTIDEIQSALRRLDEMVDLPAIPVSRDSGIAA